MSLRTQPLPKTQLKPSLQQVIHIHPQAPAKPSVGQACNGCGVCCLAEPCPVGMLISLRRHGACKALAWTDTEQRYRCSLLLSPADRPLLRPSVRLQGPAPRSARHQAIRSLIKRWGAGLWRPWAARMIAAGSGCDATLEVAPAEAVLPQQDHASLKTVSPP